MPFFMLIICLGLLLGGAIFLLRKSICLVTVIGASMTPLLEHGDRVLVLRWYPIRCLRQGQIVVLTTSPHRSTNDPRYNIWFVKRIVAMGGDTFTQETAPYPDAEIDERIHNTARVDEMGRWSWHVPAGQVFVCGDNRRQSIDSRLWGPLPLKQIRGLVLAKLSGTAGAPSESSARNITFYHPLPIGEPAPDFRAEALSGETITLESYRGKALFFLFLTHASLSSPKMPSFLKLREDLALQHIASVVVYDGTRETAQQIVVQIPASQPVLIAPRRVHAFFTDYHIAGTPAYCLLDDQHIVRATGFVRLDTATLLAQLEQARSDRGQEELHA